MQQLVDEVGFPRPDLPTRFDSVEAFAEAYEGVEGKCELVDGEVVWLTREQIGHSLLKTRIGFALEQSVRDRGSTLLVAIDGPTLKISGQRGRAPDAVVFRRGTVRSKDLVTREPVLVVEVLSPSSVRTDTIAKLAEYFSLPLVSHYLIADLDDRLVAWHRRAADGGIATSVHGDGTLAFADLGIALDVASIWPPDLGE